LLLRLPVMPLYLLEKHVTRLNSTFWWCISAAIAGLWLTRKRRYDLIYSTGGEMSAHLAAAVVARARRMPWLAEMQDPVIYQGLGRGPVARWVAGWVERTVHARATGVVYVTCAAARSAVARADGRARCTVIRPGAEAVPLPSFGVRPERMEIVHVGTLAGKRNPATLLEALAQLVTRRPSVREAVRLVLVGNVDRRARRMVEEFPYREMVELRGRIPRHATGQVLATASLLLLVQHDSPVSEQTIPSKTYEYLGSGRPILGLTFHNPELAGLLEEEGHSSVEVDDTQGIERALETAYLRWRDRQLTARPCTRYQVRGAVEKLIAWSRQVRKSGVVGSRVSQ
jgi:glycosyltransferase involved in cell wall biosynthesis